MIFLAYLIAIIASAAVAVYQYYQWQSQYWRRKGVTGPPSRPFFGNMRELNKFHEPAPLQIREWTKIYGSVFGYKEGVNNVLVTSNMEMINEVFVKQFDSFYARKAKPQGQDTDNNARVHLFEARGSRWKRLRSLASPSFSINSLKKICPIVDGSAIKMVDLLEKKHSDGQSFNVHRFFTEYTLDTICRLVFGQKESTLFDNHRMEVLKAIFLQNRDRPLFYLATGSPRLARAFVDLFAKFNLNIDSNLNKLIKEIEITVNSRIEERALSGPPAIPSDFIDIFLENAAEFDFQNRGEFSTVDSVTKALTVDEVIAQALVFLLAGYDTTSNALSYTAWMLSRHPEVMKRCQEEVNEVCTDSSISYDDCQNMRYLDAVCRETLRFFPLAAAAVSRTCMKATTIGNIEVEKGTIVMVDTYSVHFSKELWGEDADEFRPERWLEAEKRVGAINFLTFGAGPRLCIGMRLATMEEKIALAHLLRRFDVLADEQVSNLKLFGCVTTTPEQVPIKIKLRA